MIGQVEVAGTVVTYETVGHGPDLVFLHAGICDRTMWQPQVEEFADRFRVTTPDARGFGDTPIGSLPFSRRNDLAAVLDAVGAEAATLIGCSIGAGFALDFAIERPERVEKLVLVGVYPAGFEAEADPLFTELEPQVDAAIAAGDLETAGRLEARLWVDGPRRPAGSSPAWLRRRVVEWTIPINRVTDWGESVQLEPKTVHRLHEVQAPTLVIVGAEDAQDVIDACRATAAAIPGATIVELPDTAHLPNLETPTRFNRELAGFVAG